MYERNRKNELLILKEFDIKPEINIYNKDGELVKTNFKDVSIAGNKFEIILKVKGEGQSFYRGDDKDDITYYLDESAKNSRAELKKAWKEADAYFFKQKKPGLIGEPQKYNDCEEIKWTLRGEPNNFSVEIRSNKENEKTREVPNEKVEIRVEFILADKVNLMDIVGDFPPSRQSTWGWGKISLISGLAVALILVIIFQKKIWRWIKGESKQEKKVREQIDIF